MFAPIIYIILTQPTIHTMIGINWSNCTTCLPQSVFALRCAINYGQQTFHMGTQNIQVYTYLVKPALKDRLQFAEKMIHDLLSCFLISHCCVQALLSATAVCFWQKTHIWTLVSRVLHVCVHLGMHVCAHTYAHVCIHVCMCIRNYLFCCCSLCGCCLCCRCCQNTMSRCKYKVFNLMTRVPNKMLVWLVFVSAFLESCK